MVVSENVEKEMESEYSVLNGGQPKKTLCCDAELTTAQIIPQEDYPYGIPQETPICGNCGNEYPELKETNKDATLIIYGEDELLGFITRTAPMIREIASWLENLRGNTMTANTNECPCPACNDTEFYFTGDEQ